MPERKFEEDIKDCVTRLWRCENAIKKWSTNGGGNMEIFGFLNLEGNSSIEMPPHPILTLNEEEKEIWIKCFGEPLKIPKNLLVSVSIQDFFNELNAKKELYSEVIGFTNQSRFRGKNYRKQEKAPQHKTSPPKKKYVSKGKKPYKKRR